MTPLFQIYPKYRIKTFTVQQITEFTLCKQVAFQTRHGKHFLAVLFGLNPQDET